MKKNVPCLMVAAFTILLCHQQSAAQNTSPFWSLAGNSNASGSSKLGTTNATALNITTNGVSRIFVHATSGKIGIGTSSPTYRLSVVNSAGAVYGKSTSGYGVYGYSTDSAGVVGESANSTGIGVSGKGYFGIYGSGTGYGTIWLQP